MSDREQKEQEIMNQEMSKDEMESVAGGLCWSGHMYQDCHWEEAQKYGRPIHRPDGSINCANTVQDGSHCDTNDACYKDQVNYMDIHDCGKAWE